MADAGHRRLLREAAVAGVNGGDGIQLQPIGDNLYEWEAILTPSPDSVFAGMASKTL